MAEKIVSPGVFTQENDLSFVPQGVAAIGAAVIGPTVKGPAGIPTLVSSFGEYQTLFGSSFTSGSDTYEYLTSLAAEQYLQNAGQLTVVRILGTGNTQASSSWINFQEGIPTSASTANDAVAEELADGITTAIAAIDDTAEFIVTASGGHYKFIVQTTPPSNDNESEQEYYVAHTGVPADDLVAVAAKMNGVTVDGSGNTVDLGTFSASDAGTKLHMTASAGTGTAGNAFGLETGSISVTLSGGVDAVVAFTSSFKLRTRHHGEVMNSTSSFGTNGLLDSGSADNFKWEISQVNEQTGTFTLLIRRGNDTDNAKVILETWSNLSLDPKSNNYIRKIIGDQNYEVIDATSNDPFLQLTGDFAPKSSYVYVTDNLKTVDYLDENGGVRIAEASMSLPQLGTSGSFAGGSDGSLVGSGGGALFFDKISDTNVQGFDPSGTTTGGDNYKMALRLLKNQDAYDINMIMMPGVTQEGDSSITNLAKQVCEARGDAFLLVDPCLHGKTQLSSVTGKADELITSYGAMYWPWVKIFASRLGQNVWVPASVVMGGVIAFNDKVSAEWYAPAGLNRGGIGAAIQAERSLTHANRDTLYENRINPLATFPGQGVCVWGQKTLQKRPTALDRVNVRRLLINLKKFIASTSKFLVFENNTSSTRNRFLSTVNPYMESVQQNQGLYAFKVVMDETNNTPDVIDRNIMKGEIFIQPAKAAEFIVVDFNIMPTGATFGE